MSDPSIVPDITHEVSSNTAHHCDDDSQIVPEYNAPNSKDRNVPFIPTSEDLANVVVPDISSNNSIRKTKFRCSHYHTEKAWLQMHHTLLCPLKIDEQSIAPPVRRSAMTLSGGKIQHLYRVTSQVVVAWKQKPQKWWQHDQQHEQSNTTNEVEDDNSNTSNAACSSPSSPSNEAIVDVSRLFMEDNKLATATTITATATSTAMTPAITNSTLATMESNSTCCNTTITKPDLESSFDSKMKLSARVEPDKQHATATRHRLTRSITNTSIHFYQKLATKIQSKKPTTNSTMSNPCNVRGPPTSV